MKEDHYLTVLGTFDEATNEQLKILDRHLQKEGLKTLGYYQDAPWHLSLGVYHHLSKEELIDWTREVAGDMEEITLRFNHIGLFPGVVFIEPSFSWHLRFFFERLHEKYDDLFGIYIATARKYGLFTPHVSMIFTDDEQIRTVEILNEHFNPFYGKMSELMIFEYVMRKGKTYPVGMVEVIKLKMTPPLDEAFGVMGSNLVP